MKRAVLAFLRSWQFKSAIATPIFVNLASALLLFLSVLLFQGPIYRALGRDKVRGYPVYCMMEGYGSGSGDSLNVDIYVVNLTERELSRPDLAEFIQEHAANPEYSVGPDIQVEGGKLRFERVWSDSSFNGDKGTLKPSRAAGGNSCLIQVERIGPWGILKCTLVTTSRESLTRNAKGTLEAWGVKVQYAGL